MWKIYKGISRRYSRLSLQEERSLIAKAKKGSKENAEELVLRHIEFVISRIYKKTVPEFRRRFGEDLLSEALFVLGDKIKSYNLRYKDKNGNPKPVRFISYVWKRIDGFIVDYLNEEIRKNMQEECVDF